MSSSTSPNPLIPDSLARMLQQHQQFHANANSSSHPTEPHHKAFVCEICGKAFRFRSNLAEHRSVHTAVKPFVCKFCGKSSRLKGNLTKHILKHHKTEQREHIGTEDYIIKKGKKSVKDPAAIEFLEQSMIVLNNSAARGAATTGNQQQMPGTGQNDGEQQNGGEDSPLEGAITANSILLSLGLGSANLDLKEESISDAGADEGNNGGMMMEFGTNEEENAIGMEGNDAEGDGEEEEGTEEGEGEMDGNSPQQSSSGQQSPQQPIGQSTTLFGGAGTNALAAAACKAIFGQFEAKNLAKTFMGMEQMGKTESAGEQGGNGEEMLKLLAASFGAAGAAGGNGQSAKQQQMMMDDGRGEQQQQQAQQMPMTNSGSGGSSSGFRLAATQCQICSKHFRKPRDLIAHLSNAHKTLPNGTASCPSPSSSSAPLPADDFGSGGDISSPKSTSKRGNDGNEGSRGDEIVLQELRELREMLVGMKAGNGMGKVEQMLGQLDSRVCRLEKQLEMALNSIYTLVQLQTGINNSVNKLSRLNNNNNNNNNS